jgi:pyruvate kinase
MVRAGMDAVRLNFSHGDHEVHAGLIKAVRQVAGERNRAVPIIQDLQGPRFRVGDLPGGAVSIRRGATVTLSPDSGDEDTIPIRPEYSFRGIEAGQRVTIGDAGVSLKVKQSRAGKLACRVTRGGKVVSGKGIGFPESTSSLPALTDKDLEDLRFGMAHGVDFVAQSFVRSADDVMALRRRLARTEIGVISKIETRPAVQSIDGIIEVSDGVLVARGDLAPEVSISRLPMVQKLLIDKCNRRGKPVITATQMLESMIGSQQPTRAEASDVANAVFDGTDAVMLSGETAIGKYPVDTVKVMASLVRSAERAHFDGSIRLREQLGPEPVVDETIAYLAVTAARRLKAAAIITFTLSGSTALRVAKFRPEIPIFAVTPSHATRMKLGLSHGVISAVIGGSESTDAMLEAAMEAARERGVVKKGDLVAITAGIPTYISGKTNLLKLGVV